MKDKRALGIFEASVDLSMRILNGRSDAAQYGIVSTGNYWKSNLSDKIKAMEPRAAFSKFSDVETTGTLLIKHLFILKSSRVGRFLIHHVKV